MDKEYKIQLSDFEGPLDLLLHLIASQQLDIYRIPIAQVTDQYIGYLRNSLEKQMEVASEFIVMASTLIALKARALLPKIAFEEADDFAEEYDAFLDGEDELTQRLLEYRAFKDVAQVLQDWELAQSRVVSRLPMSLEPYRTAQRVVDHLRGITLGDLWEAFADAWKRTEEDRDVSVIRDRETIPERMRLIEQQLRQARATFAELLRNRSRRELVTVFLALLELIRMNRVFCSQERKFGEIWIELTKI